MNRFLEALAMRRSDEMVDAVDLSDDELETAGVGHRISSDTVAEIRRLVQGGMSKGATAAKLGIGMATVGRHTVDLPGAVRKPRSDPAKHRRIIELRGDGMTYVEIAESVGCHVHTVWNALRKVGLR